MKKLFSATIIATLGVACITSFVGCGSKAADEIAETNRAKDAVQLIRVTYFDDFEGTESPEDYEVIGQVKLTDTNPYAITWTVTSATVNDLDDYVKIGDMDETTRLVTVSITKAEKEIDYTLTATVTIDGKSESVSFDRKVPAQPKIHAGTKENPFTPSNVIEIANAIQGNAKDNYYMDEDGTPKQVYVTGYVVDCGTDQTSKGHNRVGFVWIADEYEEGKNKNSSDAVMVLSINYDSTNLTCYGDLKKGAKITVKGYIEKYIKNSTASPQPEVTYYKGNGITCEALEK